MLIRAWSRPGFGRLFLSYLIDICLLFPCVVVIGILLSVPLAGNDSLSTLGFGLVWLLGMSFMLPILWVFVIYMSILECCTGKSLGKRIMQLQVIEGKFLLKKVSFLNLLLAYFIDFFLLSCSGVLLFLLLAHLAHRNGDIAFAGFLSGVLTLFFGSLYFAICEGISNKTVGKMLVGIAVMQQDN